MLLSLRNNPNIIDLLKKIGYYLVFMQITRIIFLVINFSLFKGYAFSEIIGGIWFDLVTFCIIGFPYIFFHLLPFKFRFSKIYNLFINIIYYSILIISVVLNLIDAEYFPFTHKRSTSDLFSILTAGKDLQQEIGAYIKDFWYMFFLVFLLVALLIYIHKKTLRNPIYTSLKSGIIYFIIGVPLAFLIGRGGYTLRPISVLDAGAFTSPEKIALVLNTPFTIVKSLGKNKLQDPYFFTKEKTLTYFNPHRKSQPQHLFSQKQNVIIVILESFGSEFVGAAGAEESFTPFLDSIATQSLSFKYGIANGKRSIEAIPSIYTSIPGWMDDAYITSPYNSNRITSLAQILGQNGYESAFFHGATNGSMRFDTFLNQMGVNHYFGRTEYNNDADFNGTWGIGDEQFLPWSVREMNQFKQPFFSTIFTLSSHHPYYIPPKWKGKLKKGNHPIKEAINYSDECLRLFMNEAKKQSWYKNTLFVFVADHTPIPVNDMYMSSREYFHIPIVIFDPKGKIKPQNSKQYFQQIDLYPTLLDLLDIDTKFYSFGNSYFAHKNEGMSYSQGIYYYFYDKYLLTFQDRKPRRWFNIKETETSNTEDSLSFKMKEIDTATIRLKALIQSFYNDISGNNTN